MVAGGATRGRGGGGRCARTWFSAELNAASLSACVFRCVSFILLRVHSGGSRIVTRVGGGATPMGSHLNAKFTVARVLPPPPGKLWIHPPFRKFIMTSDCLTQRHALCAKSWIRP